MPEIGIEYCVSSWMRLFHARRTAPVQKNHNLIQFPSATLSILNWTQSLDERFRSLIVFRAVADISSIAPGCQEAVNLYEALGNVFGLNPNAREEKIAQVNKAEATKF